MTLLLVMSSFCLPSTLLANWQLSFSSPSVPIETGANFFETEVQSDNRSVRIQGVIFDNAQWTLKVIDNPDENNHDLPKRAMQAQCIAATNGGYFHSNFLPVGLVVSNGKVIHNFETARLLSGILCVTNNGNIEFNRSLNYNAEQKIHNGLQAGPYLVFSGFPPQTLETSKLARRTVLAEDGNGLWALFIMSSVTLADAGSILQTIPLGETFKVKTALNLDGGSSTTLWVNLSPKPFYLRAFTAVRNYLGIAKRNP